MHSIVCFFFFSSRRRHTRLQGDWSSDVCSSDLLTNGLWFVIHLRSQISPRRTSRRFRLTPHLAELEGNSQMLPERGSLGSRLACLSASPKALSRSVRARVSQSPVRVRVWLTGGSALESPWRHWFSLNFRAVATPAQAC